MSEAAESGEVPVIEVENLVAHYGARKILDDINLEIRKGEIMVIMGGSGSGKSTLMRHMLRLERPTAGRVLLLGRELQGMSDQEWSEFSRNLGVAFQGGALFSSLSVADNIMLPLREHTDLEEQTMEIMMRLKLEVVSLAGFEDLMPSELSGGMIKRAAFARAVVMDPALLFCDEPSAGLDPVVSAALDELILDLREAMRMTIVVVTHELESAFRIADRIAMLDRGKLLAVGTVDEVRNSDNQRIQDLLNRRFEEEVLDPEAYLARLTGQSGGAGGAGGRERGSFHMRDDRRNYLVVGFFAIGMLVALLFWVAVLSGRTGSADGYTIHYEDVMGLSPGTQIFFQGYRIGQIANVEPGGEKGFVVAALVQEDWRIPEDSVARITSSGLLAAMVINIEAGTSERILQPGDRIQSAEGDGLFEVAASLADSLTDLIDDDIEPLIAMLAERAPRIVDELEGFSKRINESAGSLSEILSEETATRVDNILSNLETTTSSAADLFTNLEGTRGQIDSLLASLDELVERSGPDVRAAVSDLRHTLAATATHIDAIARNLETSSRDLSEFGGQLRRNPAVLLRGRGQGEEAAQ